MARMYRWMSWHRSPGLTIGRVEALRAEARHDLSVRLVHLFVDLEGGQLVCVSEAGQREEVQRWFAARDLAPVELARVQWVGDHASLHEIAMFEYYAPGTA
jgi:hypothetical protein